MQITPSLCPKLFEKILNDVNKKIKRYKIIVHQKKFKSNVGRAWVNEKIIKVPTIRNIESVYIYYHEIAHVMFNHCSNDMLLYSTELEADQYALSELRRFKIHKLYPKEYEKIKFRAQHYIIANILLDIENGLETKNITSKALRFCKIIKKSK